MEECARLVRGVSWNGTAGNWEVALSHEGQGRTRESFPADKEKEAVECYDAAARGAEAKLNFPRDDGLGMAVRDIGRAKLDGVSKALVRHQCHQWRFFRTVVYYTVLPISIECSCTW